MSKQEVESVEVEKSVEDVKKVAVSQPSIMSNFMSGGEDVTPPQIIHELGVIDANIGMKADVKQPTRFSTFEVVAGYMDLINYKILAKFIRGCQLEERINSVSWKRQGRKEMVDGFVAVAMEEAKRNKSLMDDIFGGGRK